MVEKVLWKQYSSEQIFTTMLLCFVSFFTPIPKAFVSVSVILSKTWRAQLEMERSLPERKTRAETKEICHVYKGCHSNFGNKRLGVGGGCGERERGMALQRGSCSFPVRCRGKHGP